MENKQKNKKGGRPRTKENDKQKHIAHFRFSEDEKKILEGIFQYSVHNTGKKRKGTPFPSIFIKKLVFVNVDNIKTNNMLGNNIPHKDISKMIDQMVTLKKELNYIGNNLNQIALKINKREQTTAEEIFSVLATTKETINKTQNFFIWLAREQNKGL